MCLKMIMVVAMTLKCIHSTYGIRESAPSLMRSTSTPNLRMVYNETSTDTNKDIITCDEYKKNIYNRYKRNTYLRSKEKYSFDNK